MSKPSALYRFCKSDKPAQTLESPSFGRSVILQGLALLVSPYTVGIDQTVLDGILVGEKSIHHLFDDLLEMSAGTPYGLIGI